MPDIVDGDLIFSGSPPIGAFFVSYHRPSLHIPRRDLVFARSDALVLAVTVVQYDDPDALPLLLTGGLGGPELRMVVRRPSVGDAFDYGALPGVGVVAAIGGTISASMAGTFNITLGGSAMATWPSRSYYEIQLNNPSGLTSRILVRGMLHLTGGSTISYGDIPLFTDLDEAVLSDDSIPVEVV